MNIDKKIDEIIDLLQTDYFALSSMSIVIPFGGGKTYVLKEICKQLSSVETYQHQMILAPDMMRASYAKEFKKDDDAFNLKSNNFSWQFSSNSNEDFWIKKKGSTNIITLATPCKFTLRETSPNVMHYFAKNINPGIDIIFLPEPAILTGEQIKGLQDYLDNTYCKLVVFEVSSKNKIIDTKFTVQVYDR